MTTGSFPMIPAKVSLNDAGRVESPAAPGGAATAALAISRDTREQRKGKAGRIIPGRRQNSPPPRPRNVRDRGPGTGGPGGTGTPGAGGDTSVCDDSA